MVSCLVLALLPTKAAAAGRLVVSPGSVKTEVNKTFTVNINLSSDEAVNSASGQVIFPGSLLQATAVSQAGSIFTLWPEPPTISGETVNFAGGLPSPGYTGTGKLFSITFKAKAAGTANISIANGRTLANNANATNVYAGFSGAVVTITTPPPTFAAATISSTSHPDQKAWYKIKTLELTWTKPSRATSFEYSLTGGKSGKGTNTSISFPDLTDGVWRFELTTIYPDGKASSGFTAQIDTVAPQQFTVTTERQSGSTDPKPILKFKAQDATSGIAEYEIIIDGKSIARTSEEHYQLPLQLPGKHNFIVKAYDRAGNSTEAVGMFNVDGFAGPIITEWPTLLSVLEPVTFRGRARLDSTVALFIDGEKVAEFPVKNNLSEEARANTNVNNLPPETMIEWVYTYHGVIYPGSHLVYAHQVRPDGAYSNRSNEITLHILWTSIRVGGASFPLVALAIAFNLLLLILLIAIWYRFKLVLARMRQRVRKVKEEVDADLLSLEKNLDKRGLGTHDTIELTRNSLDHELDGISSTPSKKKPTKK